MTRQAVRKPARTAAGAVVELATREAALRALAHLGASDVADTVCPRCGEVLPVGSEIVKRAGEWVCRPCGQEGRE